MLTGPHAQFLQSNLQRMRHSRSSALSGSADLGFYAVSAYRETSSGPDRGEMGAAAYSIKVAILGYSVAIFFLNFGYAFEFLLVSGLIEAIWRVARDNSDFALGSQPAMAAAREP